MKDILATLVAFPTISTDLAANREALDYIDHFLSERGLFVERFTQNGHASLVATTQRTKKPHVMLAAHLDVVHGPERLFCLKEHEGKLYGRGTCDMKFAIAAYLQLIDDLQEDLSLYDIGIMITADEEIGGYDGTKMLLEAGYIPTVCVLPDGGDNWALEESAKGIFWLEFTAAGNAAHASRPWEGESAIEKMTHFLQILKAELFDHQTNDTNTCNIGTITGGNAPNQVADTCKADVDIRFLNGNERTRLLDRIHELCEAYDVACEVHLDEPAIEIDLSHPLVVAFAQCIEQITGAPLRTMRSNAGSDARHFMPYDVPVLVTYPPGGGRHGNDEWIDEVGFYRFRDLLQAYVEQVATLPAKQPKRPRSLTSAE